MEVLIPIIGGPLDGTKHLIEDPERRPPDELRFPVKVPLVGLAEGGPATTIGPEIDFHTYQRWYDCGRSIYKYVGIRKYDPDEGEPMSND